MDFVKYFVIVFLQELDFAEINIYTSLQSA